ncbi:MAG: glycosyltransferase, partial [Burkholderiales bacterium]
MSAPSTPLLSVVIPVYNEEDGLPALFARLYPALDALGCRYEIVFTNDGSIDRSVAVLREQYQKRPDVTRVILFNGNFGQHMAIMAGFAHCRGSRIVKTKMGMSTNVMSVLRSRRLSRSSLRQSLSNLPFA